MRVRCNNAAGMALITNPRFSALAWVRAMARKFAQDLLQKDGDADGLLDLSCSDARGLLEPTVPRIIRMQQSSGLWRKKNAREISFALLKALAHTDLLQAVAPRLRRDPYQSFRDADDWLGMAVRRQVLREPRRGEPALKKRLLQEFTGRQSRSGAWEDTVVATVHHLEILSEVGLAETPCFARGIAYLFACVQPDVPHRRSGPVVAHHMITSPDLAAEFRSTARYRPQWLPHIACHSHLPMIQTYYALRLLNKSGYADDPRVIRACQNIVDLRERFGGWCVSNIRRGLEAEARDS